MAAYIHQFFQVLIEAGGSDLHLGEGEPVSYTHLTLPTIYSV